MASQFLKPVLGTTGLFFVLLLGALFVTGVFQQGIWPRLAPHVPKSKLSFWRKANPAPLPPPREERPVAMTPQTVPLAVPDPDPAPSPARTTRAELKRLARVYEGMRPKEAAAILETTELGLAVEILTVMRERQAARILGHLSPRAAARITERLAAVTDDGIQATRPRKGPRSTL